MVLPKITVQSIRCPTPTAFNLLQVPYTLVKRYRSTNSQGVTPKPCSLLSIGHSCKLDQPVDVITGNRRPILEPEKGLLGFRSSKPLGIAAFHLIKTNDWAETFVSAPVVVPDGSLVILVGFAPSEINYHFLRVLDPASAGPISQAFKTRLVDQVRLASTRYSDARSKKKAVVIAGQSATLSPLLRLLDSSRCCFVHRSMHGKTG